ncbi:hypothetical protein DFS34DRAFT_626910 [Phlyctochytrium arcticum]|nr:hypothetical protein DFS34DRAFT_626910 [Phlyctochytrium arcticum]
MAHSFRVRTFVQITVNVILGVAVLAASAYGLNRLGVYRKFLTPNQHYNNKDTRPPSPTRPRMSSHVRTQQQHSNG